METRTKILAIATLAVAAFAGCTSSSNNTASGGTGGIGGSGSGGKAATGGASGTGGATSTGGSSTTGGSSSAGGAGASGGRTGSGGSTATGGTAGQGPGGVTGTGGNSEPGGAGGTSVGVDGGSGRDAIGRPDVGPSVEVSPAKEVGADISSGGSDGAGGDFQPCPTNGDPCKVLPLGDSITWGINYGGGYRIKLFTHTVTDSKNITFVGYDTGNPPDSTALSKLGTSSSKWVGKHEGHSGWTIQQDDDLVTGKSTANNDSVNYAGKKVVADFGPHIVLVHLGTNDLNLGQASGAPDRLGTLIDHIVADAPGALVVVAKIIPLPSQASGVTTFNNAIPGVVKQRADAGKHVIVVDQFSVITSSDMDSVHPHESGYEKMAVVWYDAIKPYLH